MGITVITGPSEEPVSLTMAKGFLRIDVSDTTEDQILNVIIKAARRLGELHCKRAFITTTLEQTLDGFPFNRHCLSRNYQSLERLPQSNAIIQLEKPPLVSVTSITYVDSNGDVSVLDDNQYHVSPGSPGRIEPAYGLSWPQARCQMDSVKIRYVAGFGNASAVPEDAVACLCMVISHLYNHREIVSDINYTEVPVTMKALLSSLDWGFYG